MPGPDWFDKPADDWSGNYYTTSKSMLDALTKLYEPVDPPPTFEERRQRCEDMGLVLCSCTGVETERGRKLIYDLGCPIHGASGGRKR